MKNEPVPDFALDMDLPELAELDATADAARIYREIRTLGGVPMVALIYRHLATLPGALEWMWESLSPAWRDGVIQEAAWRIARAAPLEPIAFISRPALTALGVDEEGIEEIRTVIESYDRANPENLLTVLCVLRLLSGREASRERALRSWTPPVTPAPLVAMAELRSLPLEISELLALVAEPSPPGASRVVPSLYRHFLHRPGFLALVVTLLRQRMEDGSIDAAVARIHEDMTRAADEIASTLRAPPAPHPGIEPACTRFAGGIIPRMIVVGRLLRASMPR